MDFSEFIFEFKSFKIILKRIKEGLFSRGTHANATGMQGDMAEPRGPTRAPAWRRGDTCVHMFIYS